MWVQELEEYKYEGIRNDTRIKLTFKYKNKKGEIHKGCCYYDRINPKCNDPDYFVYKPNTKDDWERIIGEEIIKY